MSFQTLIFNALVSKWWHIVLYKDVFKLCRTRIGPRGALCSFDRQGCPNGLGIEIRNLLYLWVWKFTFLLYFGSANDRLTMFMGAVIEYTIFMGL